MRCSYRYLTLVDSDHYTFLPPVLLQGWRTGLSPSHNSVLVSCRRPRGWVGQLVLHLQAGALGSLLRWLPQAGLYSNILPYLAPRPANSSTRGERTKYSVVVLVIDSLSQMNLVRSLPRTKAALEALGGLVFAGHHKVGHNSWPNVMALLGGEERPVWPLDLARESCYYVEEEHRPLLLQEFGGHGWTSLYLEDFQLYGNFAREGKMGFRTPPAHHYYRAAYWALTREKGLGGGGFRNRLVGKADNYACHQELPAHVHQLRILEDLVTSQPGPVFAYMHLNEYTHNDLVMAAQYDSPLTSLLHRLAAKNALNDTFFILVADHGFQRGDNPFTLTEQGRTENNMPALAVVPPASLAVERPGMVAALRHNSGGLTSHLDVYATLREVLAMGAGDQLEERKLVGRSLLHPVPPRSCQEAGVPPQYCSCSSGQAKLQTSTLAPLARALLQDLDVFLAPTGLCTPLVLKEVKEASVHRQKQEQVVQLRVTVVPASAQFEVVVTVGQTGGVSSLVGVQVTRLDWYSATSSCLPGALPHLRPYCVCES